MLTLNDGRSELWQWDTGRTLAVDADCSQVHFSNKVFGRSIDVDVIDGTAIIPDVLLQTDKDLNVWAFVGTAENGYTKISKTFKVNRRNKPADYVFTPTDQMTLQTIQSQIGDLADLTTEAKDTLVAAINEAARTGGGAGSMDLRVADGYVQYSTDGGMTWTNLIAMAELKGADGITPTIGSNGNWYIGNTDTGKPSRGENGPAGSDGKDATVDASLTQSGQAADAKVTGDRLDSLSEEIVTTAESKVSTHNAGTDTHSDIRLLISGLADRLNALADSDDTTLDQLSEVVAYIKSNRTLIEAITTSKVSVADIIDNLTTNVANKPLSAAQGVALKALIDGIVIPDKLPNPNALTFTGAVAGSYDGSAPMSVEIPSGGDYELPVASATQLGGVMPAAKTDDMTQAVGVDETGGLWALPGGASRSWRLVGTVDFAELYNQGVTSFEYALSSPDAIYLHQENITNDHDKTDSRLQLQYDGIILGENAIPTRNKNVTQNSFNNLCWYFDGAFAKGEKSSKSINKIYTFSTLNAMYALFQPYEGYPKTIRGSWTNTPGSFTTLISGTLEIWARELI